MHKLSFYFLPTVTQTANNIYPYTARYRHQPALQHTYCRLPPTAELSISIYATKKEYYLQIRKGTKGKR